MRLDKMSALLLSEIFLDLSKAWIIGTSVTPVLTNTFIDLRILTLGIFNATVAFVIARLFKEVK